MNKKHASQDYVAEVLDIYLKAGRLMIEDGSETYRVGDMMMRIARSASIAGARCFTTPTGIFMSLGKHSYTQVTQVKRRNINLGLVNRVNEPSREFAAKKVTLKGLQERLRQISTSIPDFPIRPQIIGATTLNSTLMVLFIDDYDWIDFPAAIVIGSVSYVVYLAIKRYANIHFLVEVMTVIFMEVVAIFVCKLFPRLIIDSILTGPSITLVPGVAITNTLRDLFGGGLLSGIVRTIEAVLIAIVLGDSIGITIKLLWGVM